MFSKDLKKAGKQFVEFSKRENNSEFIDIKRNIIKRDVEIKGEKAAKEYVENFLAVKEIKLDCLGLKGYGEIRQEVIMELKQNSNLSVRQIAAILKINRGMVQRAKRV